MKFENCLDIDYDLSYFVFLILSFQKKRNPIESKSRYLWSRNSLEFIECKKEECRIVIKIKNFKTIYIHIKKTSLHEVSISSESFYYQYFYNEHVSSNFNNIIKYNRIWIMNFCSTKNSFFFTLVSSFVSQRLKFQQLKNYRVNRFSF